MHGIRIVMQRFALLVLLTLIVLASGVSQGRAGAPESLPTGVWTVVIPVAFPDDVFTWRLKADGTYEEDGVEAQTGRSIQETKYGRWVVKGARMTLSQTDIAFVFDGVVVGDRYSGTLTLSGKDVSYFCAAKGTVAPEACVTNKVSASR